MRIVKYAHSVAAALALAAAAPSRARSQTQPQPAHTGEHRSFVIENFRPRAASCCRGALVYATRHA